jgi:putative effector of murein hydrolase LrgA (UPF0299 family)
MNFIKQFGIIVSISYISELLSQSFNLPVPGNVLGFIILFALLQTRVLKLESVEATSQVLVSHMPIMFVPLGVNLILYSDLLREFMVPLLIIITVSPVIVMSVTGWLVQILNKGGRDYGRKAA